MAEPQAASTRQRQRANGSRTKPSSAPPVAAVRNDAPGAPHDPGAEAAVLSAITLAPDTLDEVRDILEPIDFYNAQHQVVYEAVLAVDAAGTRIDIVTVAAQLRAMGKLQDIGGTGWLSMLIDATPTVANVLEHARLVRQLGLLRRMGTQLRELAYAAARPETRANVPAFLERCEAEVFMANAHADDRETSGTLHDVMAIAAIALDPSRPRDARGITTGMRDLDELTLGMAPGELWYVAGRPGMGKTALAMGMAVAAVATGAHAGVVFSMEMERAELGERMISSHSGVRYRQLMQRQLSDRDWESATAAMSTLGQYPLVVDDTSSLTPSRLRSRLRRHLSKLRAAHPYARPGVVVVDYVQLMAADNPSGQRNEELERISRSLKLLAKEFNLCVVALAQLNRGQKDRADKRPGLFDLRGSGALEQDADKVLFIHRDESEGEERGDAELILAKGRNAGTGRVSAIWQPWCVRFIDREQAGFEWGPSNYDE